MKFEVIEKSKKKRWIIGSIAVIGLISIGIYAGSYAKYQNIEDIKLVEGNINYKPYDFKMMAMYKSDDGTNYTEIDKTPGSNYKINEEKSYCTINNVDKDNSAMIYTDRFGHHVFNNLSKNSKCYVWFDKNTEVVNTVLGSIEVNNYTPDFSETATTDEGVYAVSGGMYGGTSYYWRGATTTNYLKFGGYCWRIVRINGDGTIRLIYDGATCHNNGESTADSIVANSAYNLGYNKSEYVGWKYIEGLQRPNSTTEGTDATIKTKLEEWYNTNLKNYESKIAVGKYCNDRNEESGSTWTSAPSSTFYFASNRRLYANSAPTLSCGTLDIYTLKVGLITADEVMYAGGKGASNKQYYLYNGQRYWTMTPNQWSYHSSSSFGTSVSAIDLNGFLSGGFYVYGTYGVRPVINLKTDTQISGGNGTKDNPYIVV
ncbi:MAG: hypothetical protein OSJ63_04125 [Bacilli bacterium]|nr:hypothetical protein [Bacilli bacterium]